MQDSSAKQNIIERVKGATNILVTVSRNPSVDDLAAALGLTLMLNKLDKHATAVFSGAIPDAIAFLEPAKTFEHTVDSLRDFIIALDKEKADRLRYKVEDDVVRIFITPYRTTITDKDLQFTQGDFNVELVVALGVEKREDLDAAITAHGRILHDATVVTINTQAQKSSLGSIDWSDEKASSLCEMLMSLSEALQSGLLDEQISSALLTGIVAATDRFSNPHTSPRVMTMAAQLMAAGANQQLIAAKLEEGHELPPKSVVEPDGSKPLKEGSSQKVSNIPEEKLHKDDSNEPEVKQADGEMHITHDDEHSVGHDSTLEPESVVEPEPEPEQVPVPAEPRQDKDANSSALDEALSAAHPANVSVSDLQNDLAEANKEMDEAANLKPVSIPNPPHTPPPLPEPAKSDWREKIVQPPSFGGTLNATTDAAAEAKMAEERSNRNHTLLSHDDPAARDFPPEENSDPLSSSMSFEETPVHHPSPLQNTKPRTIMPLTEETPITKPLDPSLLNDNPEPLVAVTAPASGSAPTLAELEAQAHAKAQPAPVIAGSIDDARAAVDAALGGQSFNPSNQPLQGVAAQPLPMSSPAMQDSAIPLSQALPPMPDFSTLPPLPPPPVDFSSPHPAANPLESPIAPVTSANPSDPGQFRIPGQ